MLTMRCLKFVLRFVVLLRMSLALQVQRDAGASLGAEIGTQVRGAEDEIAADMNRNAGKSEFQDAYVKSLTASESVIVNPEVSKVLRKSNMLAGNLDEKDVVCERRWAASCPDGWSTNAAGTCIAPASYKGPCARADDFQSVAAKRHFAEKCHAPWPCEDECPSGRDYSATCPQSWEDNGGGFCSAPAGFQTKCATLYDFAEMEVNAKQELATTCGFTWPCKIECAQDYTKSCPEDWTEVPMSPGLCVAPTTYAGICSYSVNTSAMTLGQKQAFARKCGAQFPCEGPASANRPSIESQSMLPDGPIDDNGQIISSA